MATSATLTGAEEDNDNGQVTMLFKVQQT